MKICIVIPSLSGGGAEFVAREWANWLAAQGHDVIVAITNAGDEEFVSPNVSVVRLVGGNPAAHVYCLWRLVSSRRVEAVVGLLPYFNFLAVLATILQSRNPVCIVSGRNVEVPFPEVHGKKVKVMRALSKVLYPMADGFIAISHPVAAEAGALYGLDPEKIAVIPNPATGKIAILQKDAVFSKNIEEMKRHRENAEIIKLVVPARISEQKRPALVMDVAKRLSEMKHCVEVHFYGDGPMRLQVEELAAQYNIKVTVHGWVEDWFTLAPGDGIVFLPSSVEGFGNVFVEAACAGLPSVAPSRALGVADAIVPNVTGQLVTFDRVEDYVSAILTARQMRLNPETVSRWADRFSVRSSGSYLEQFLLNLWSSANKEN